jgi:hypothetical protein
LTIVLQIGIALAMAAAILWLGWWGIRYMAAGAGADPDPGEVVEVEGSFRCMVCGMRLTVTHAQGADVAAPRHCREEMEPV